MRLSHLTDKTLLAEIKKLVVHERRATLEVLFHLREIDRRKLYCDLKYNSLFAYCTEELGYSESSAQRRIVAARLLEDLPEIAEKIESGSLTLSNLSQVGTYFKTAKEQKEVIPLIENLSRRDCEKKLFELSGVEKKINDKAKRVSAEKIQMAIVLKDETIALMEKVRNLIGKNAETDELIQFAMSAAIEKIEKTKFKHTAKPKAPPPAEVSRYVSSHVKREVYARDKKCTNCRSLKNLEFDHRFAYALGGKSTIENIRMLCSACNQRSRIRAGLFSRSSSSYAAPASRTDRGS